MPRTFTSLTDGDLTDPSTWNETYDITAVNTVAKRFTIAGDHTAEFTVGDSIAVAGSTGNDGTYTVASATLSGGNTLIVVSEVVISPVADGTLQDQILPTDGDSLVVNDEVTVGDELVLVSISGSGTLIISQDDVVDVASLTVAQVTVGGTLTGTTEKLVIEGSALTIQGDSELTGDIDFKSGSITDVGALSSFTVGQADKIIRLFIDVHFTVDVALAGEIQVFKSLQTDNGNGGQAEIKLMQKSAELILQDTVITYEGAIGSSASMRMGL